MALYVYFNFFKDSIEVLDGEWNARLWFDGLFWKMVLDAHHGVCEHGGCIVHDVDKIGIVGIDWIRNLVLKNS